jgi:WD40 repeat protein
LAYSPDGRRLASASFDKTVKVWNANTGEVLLNLAGHTDFVFGVAYSPDGRYLASASWDRTVKVWDAVTGKELRTLKGHTGRVNCVAYSPDGRHLASAGEDQTVKVWDASTGQELFTLQGHPHIVHYVAYSPDGRRLASAGDDQSVRVWDLSTGQELLCLQGHAAGVFGVAYSRDGGRLAAASEDGTVREWDATALTPQLLIEREARSVVQFLFAKLLPRSEVLAAIREDATISQSVRQEAMKLAETFPENTNALALNNASRAVVREREVATISEVCRLSGHVGSVHCVGFTSDGKFGLSGGQDKTLRVWDVTTGKQQRHIDTGDSIVPGFAIAPDGERVLIGCLGNKSIEGFSLWDMKLDKKLARLPGGQTWSNCAGFSPDSRRAIVNGHGNILQVWDLDKRQVIGRILGQGWIEGFAVSPDFRRVITRTQWQPSVSLWDLESGRLLHNLTGHTEGVLAVAISPDNRLAITGSKDKSIRLWDLVNCKVLRSFCGHGNHVTCLAFSPDCKRILSGSSDQTVRIWDIASGAEIARCSQHKSTLASLAISLNGRLGISADGDGNILMWQMPE